ncbi:hypothetical protein [Edaphobacter modestus]|uniref:Uncharacterized protein n=1 Tax=Edaphobacter modestus TaxID=388466 RepID=A0A4Q7YYX8_9BACT|nr:hypothetical protein [Edaphobacter modestus]RZU42359.1 hypothetical protein BDD14_3925 [Edaphobacter modestus]
MDRPYRKLQPPLRWRPRRARQPLSNVYPTTIGIVFPTDVQSTSYLINQIAVLYDSDSAITDLLLGNGASSPSSCRQNAVTESFDSIARSGKIQHALLVLNGRCTGPAPEQQLQLQYQLMRAFGRVIGLGWSQTNDNVFTGTPQPTIQQALHWPVMHPIDVICGPYTYQCMPQPFTLRDDDVSGLCLLYPVGSIVPSVPGKTDTLARANRVLGNVTSPNGQGMQGVNVVIHRLEPSPGTIPRPGSPSPPSPVLSFVVCRWRSDDLLGYHAHLRPRRRDYPDRPRSPPPTAPEITRIAAAATGTEGFLAFDLQKHP